MEKGKWSKLRKVEPKEKKGPLKEKTLEFLSCVTKIAEKTNKSLDDSTDPTFCNLNQIKLLLKCAEISCH